MLDCPLCYDRWHVADSNHYRLLAGVTFGLGLPGVWAGTLLDNGFRWLF